MTKKPARANATTAVRASSLENRQAKLATIGGSQSDAWNNLLATQALQGLWRDGKTAEGQDRHICAIIQALVGIAPKDELEGMMAAQLIAAHNAAMECYRRATIAGQTFDGWRESLSQANKLSRTFATLLEALNRHRGKGQQKVTVEHVHVHAGGQAVVGTVDMPGGGDRGKSEEQPDAKQIAYAPEPALPGSNPEERVMSIAGHGERPVPNARRRLARCAESK